MRIYLDTTLQEIFESKLISGRTYNCLRLANLMTMEDLLKFSVSPSRFFGLKNFGSKCYAEILPLLREVKSHKSMKPVGPEEVFAAMGDTIGKMLEEAYETLCTEETDVAKYFKTCHPSVEALHMAVTDDVKHLLKIHSQLSMAENVEMRRLYVRYLEGALDRMRNGQQEQYETVEKYLATLTELQPKIKQFTYREKAEYFLSPSARKLLQSIYLELCEKQLGTRARNFLMQVAPQFEVLAQYFDAERKDYQKLCPNQIMKKSLAEVYELNQRLREQFDRYWQMSNDELLAVQIQREYPFLSNDERTQVQDYIRQYGRRPMFFLLYHYMRHSEARTNKAYSALYGIASNKENSLKEVGNILSLSSERVRQIVTQNLEVHRTPLSRTETWKDYDDLLSLPYITAESAEFLQLKEREYLGIEFRGFARLMQLLGERGFEVPAKNQSGEPILLRFTSQYQTFIVDNAAVVINRAKMPTIKMAESVGSIRTMMATSSKSDTPIRVETLLSNVSEEEKADAVQLMTYVAQEGLGLAVNDNGEVIVPKNRIDVAEELWQILAQKGEPMSVDELFKAFKQKNPTHRYTDSARIRPYLFRHPHMKPIGNSSRYGLDSWDHIFYGTIRELLIKILEESEEPMHIQELYKSVTAHYPDTKPQSLECSMSEDTYNRFVHFRKGYYGLRSKQYDEAFQECDEVKQNFQRRFEDFRQFVKEHNRYPLIKKGEAEVSLARWMYNAINGVLNLTDEQQQQLEAAMKADEEAFIPRNATEYEFRKNCEDYKAYFVSHHAHPSSSKAPELYYWMKRSRANYDNYTDHRKKYLTDLLNDIQPRDLFGGDY